MEGYIYFIEAVGTPYTKIGLTSKNPFLRINQLQTGCPHELRMSACYWVPDIQTAEKKVHGRFATYRKRGEWFDLSHVTIKWDVHEREEEVVIGYDGEPVPF